MMNSISKKQWRSVCLLASCVGAVTSARAETTIAIGGIENLTVAAERDNLGRGFASMLASQLAKQPHFRVIERLRLDQVLKEQDSSYIDLFDASKRSRLSQVVGVPTLLVGSVAREGDSIWLTIRLVDVAQGVATATAYKAIDTTKDVGEQITQLETTLFSKRQCPKHEPRVAVMPFDDADGGRQGGNSLGEAITTVLVQQTSSLIVERSQLRHVMDEYDLQFADIAKPEIARRVGRLLGAQQIFCGSITNLGNKRIVDGRLIDVESAHILSGTTAEWDGGFSSILGVAEQIVGSVTRKIFPRVLIDIDCNLCLVGYSDPNRTPKPLNEEIWEGRTFCGHARTEYHEESEWVDECGDKHTVALRMHIEKKDFPPLHHRFIKVYWTVMVDQRKVQDYSFSSAQFSDFDEPLSEHDLGFENQTIAIELRAKFLSNNSLKITGQVRRLDVQ
ncbi:MAG: CsgG/HfaB family protein [Phycisphaerales bacterium]|nr:CsgG/HfaB family protein [Phycisphaerales bacterium]